MVVKFDIAALRRTTWHEYLTRFLFGGAVTVAAGLIADKYGSGIGGLFLAFPAIFPASASLIQKHEREKKKKVGEDGTNRAKMAAGIDAFGASMGCVGLLIFALTAWQMLPRLGGFWAIFTATLLWMTTAPLVWWICRRFHHAAEHAHTVHSQPANPYQRNRISK